jgi:hypothetical protein
VWRRVLWWISAPYHIIRAAIDVWQDIGDLTCSYSWRDFHDYHVLEEKVDDSAIDVTCADAAEIQDCGRCYWCRRPVWYAVTYSSAGIPVGVLLCCSCAWHLVRDSPHIIECHLSARRARRLLREQAAPATPGKRLNRSPVLPVRSRAMAVAPNGATLTFPNIAVFVGADGSVGIEVNDPQGRIHLTAKEAARIWPFLAAGSAIVTS